VFTVEKHMLCYFIDGNQIDVLRILHRRMDVDSRIV
jgi:plasmid stabilization system protein ParE